MRSIKYSKSEETLNIAILVLVFILSLIFFSALVLEVYRGKILIEFLHG